MPDRISARSRVWNIGAVRKAFLLVLLALLWEGYARWLNNPLLFPTFVDTVKAFLAAMVSGELPKAASYTIQLLLKGYAAGLAAAALLTAFASMTRIGADLLEMLTSMFNPLPSIALLPLALIWFGLGNGSIIFVLIQAVLWTVALNTFSGFRAVSPTLRMVGQNYGLSKIGYVARILIPGAFPSILTGLKVGWAFAWRTLIAAELVFGVSSGSGLVYFRAEKPAFDSERICGTPHGNPVWTHCRKSHLPDHRESYRPPLGHAGVR
jgi:NitT/TauT family transport system permease protein